MPIKVPTKALTVLSEESGEPLKPEIGDTVEFSGTAKVLRAEADGLVLDVMNVNGDEVSYVDTSEVGTDLPAEETEAITDPEGLELAAQAQAADEEGFGAPQF